MTPFRYYMNPRTEPCFKALPNSILMDSLYLYLQVQQQQLLLLLAFLDVDLLTVMSPHSDYTQRKRVALLCFLAALCCLSYLAC